jgi:hypothetical protein
MALSDGKAHSQDRPAQGLMVDCASCVVRGLACPDCVVSVLLGGPPERIELDADELGALDVLAGSGLVPPLRLVRAVDGPDPNPDTG